MGYERPAIVRREQVSGLTLNGPSDLKQPDTADSAPSDVHKKDNVVPVAWGEAEAGDPGRYESPSITRRDEVAGLTIDPSDVQQPDGADSDVHKKDNVVAVAWGEAESGDPGRYESPSITRRDEVAGLTIDPSDLQPDNNTTSDVHKKDNVVPVRW